MILRLLQNPTARTTKQSLFDDCCDDPSFQVERKQGRHRGARTEHKVYCVNCNKDLVSITTR